MFFVFVLLSTCCVLSCYGCVLVSYFSILIKPMLIWIVCCCQMYRQFWLSWLDIFQYTLCLCGIAFLSLGIWIDCILIFKELRNHILNLLKENSLVWNDMEESFKADIEKKICSITYIYENFNCHLKNYKSNHLHW